MSESSWDAFDGICQLGDRDENLHSSKILLLPDELDQLQMLKWVSDRVEVDEVRLLLLESHWKDRHGAADGWTCCDSEFQVFCFCTRSEKHPVLLSSVSPQQQMTIIIIGEVQSAMGIVMMTLSSSTRLAQINMFSLRDSFLRVIFPHGSLSFPSHSFSTLVRFSWLSLSLCITSIFCFTKFKKYGHIV